MGGRPPKPTELHELTGAFKKNPSRRRARSGGPKAKGRLGDPPEWMQTDSGRYNKYPEIWYELRDQVPEGVGFFNDREQFASLVKVTSEIRRPGKTSPALYGVQNKLFAQFGMNGEGRARRAAMGVVNEANPAPAADALTVFMGGKKKAG